MILRVHDKSGVYLRKADEVTRDKGLIFIRKGQTTEVLLLKDIKGLTSIHANKEEILILDGKVVGDL